MKQFSILIVLIAVALFSCSKKEEGLRLKEGSADYEFAQTLAEKLPVLDPGENATLVSTEEFNITVGSVVHEIRSNSGRRADQLKNLDEEKLRSTIRGIANDMAEKRLLYNAAKESGVPEVSQAEVDSVLQTQYDRAGGKDKFMNFLKSNGIDFAFVKNQMHRGLVIQHYLESTMAEKAEVTEDEIQDAYEKDKTATVRHILLNTRGKTDSAKQEIYKQMEAILQEARNGKDFAELAKKYSEDPGSKNKGGLYENIQRGQMVKPFEDAAFSVPVGEISDIIETRYGYHIVKVIERQKENRPLEEIHGQLEKQLEQQKRSEVYQNLLAQLKDDAGFEMKTF